MKLFSYVVKNDTGFSPNPFWGYCTLADCKPAIRRTARVGDWVVGLSSKSRGHHVVYAMKVDEIMSYAQYFCDRRFVKKIPNYVKGEVIYKTGDNIYEPLPNGELRQLQSMHSKGEYEDPKSKRRDLSGKYVLIGKVFHYFGSAGPELPTHLNGLKVARGHKNRFSQTVISDFLDFILSYPQGVLGQPAKWPRNDGSWHRRKSETCS